MTVRRKRLVGMFIDNFAKFETHVDAWCSMRRAPHPGSRRIGGHTPVSRQDRASAETRPWTGLFFAAAAAMTAGRSGRQIVRPNDPRHRIAGSSAGADRELHPVVRTGRAERQQGRDRRAAAFDASNAPGLPERVREHTIKLAGQRATKDGVMVIEAGRFRTQEHNRADARDRLTELVVKAAEPPPKPRKKTKPTKGSVERRLKTKAGRSTVKKMRGKVEND